MGTITKQNNLNPARFLNPESLLSSVPVMAGMIVGDFGCGNGYYSVAAATMVGSKGEVYAIDILEDALSQTSTLAKLIGLRNIVTKQGDLEKFGGCDLPPTSGDLVIMASLLHQVENKKNVIREAYRVLKTGGKVLVVEWKPDAAFGPAVADRIALQDAKKLLEEQGFRPLTELPAGSFHYALLYEK